MTPHVEVITPEASISEAAEKMRHLEIGQIPPNYVVAAIPAQ